MFGNSIVKKTSDFVSNDFVILMLLKLETRNGDGRIKAKLYQIRLSRHDKMGIMISGFFIALSVELKI